MYVILQECINMVHVGSNNYYNVEVMLSINNILRYLQKW